jgi:hypothetical protein
MLAKKPTEIANAPLMDVSFVRIETSVQPSQNQKRKSPRSMNGAIFVLWTGIIALGQ